MSYQPTFYDFHTIFYRDSCLHVRARVRSHALHDNQLSPARKVEGPGVWLLYQSVAPMGTSS